MLRTIRRKKEIERIFREGLFYDSPLFKANYLVGKEGICYALSVPKRLGIAVKRNRARRIFRSALQRFFSFSILCIFRLKKIDFTFYDAGEELRRFQRYLEDKVFPEGADKAL